jgi:hypothetical protein
MNQRRAGVTLLAVGLLLSLGPLSASATTVESVLSSYTGVNGEGYLQPLANALGADLNDAFFYSAHIPKSGLRFSIEIAVMSVMFEDEAKTFMGTTEGGFVPASGSGTVTTEVPTIVGNTQSVTVAGAGGTSFTFPGGFDLSSFALAVPQLRVGAVMGTEAVVRFFAADVRDNDADLEVKKIDLFGLGVRHSVSQYFESLPVSLAVGGMWQSFSMGENDFVESTAFTLGVQGSKRFSLLEPYAGLSYDSFNMDVTFDSEVSGSSEKIEFDTISTVRFTVGLGLNYRIGNAFAEYNLADTNSFAFGITFGK